MKGLPLWLTGKPVGKLVGQKRQPASESSPLCATFATLDGAEPLSSAIGRQRPKGRALSSLWRALAGSLTIHKRPGHCSSNGRQYNEMQTSLTCRNCLRDGRLIVDRLFATAAHKIQTHFFEGARRRQIVWAPASWRRLLCARDGAARTTHTHNWRPKPKIDLVAMGAARVLAAGGPCVCVCACGAHPPPTGA